MEHAKKFILMDPAKLNSTQTAAPVVTKNDTLLTKPEVKELMELDSEMNTILNDKAISVEEKVRLYNQALSKYQSAHKKASDCPIKVSIDKDKLIRDNSSAEYKHEQQITAEGLNQRSSTDGGAPFAPVLLESNKRNVMDSTENNSRRSRPKERGRRGLKKKNKKSLNDWLSDWEVY